MPADFDGWQVATGSGTARTELPPHSLLATTFALRG